MCGSHSLMRVDGMWPDSFDMTSLTGSCAQA
jgi:hypothetical protein